MLADGHSPERSQLMKNKETLLKLVLREEKQGKNKPIVWEGREHNLNR
jgi:hypothetical protein